MEYKSDELIKIDSKWKDIFVDENKIATMNINYFITDEHIDIIVRYLYVKAYVEKKNYFKYKNLYEKMMHRRVNKSYYEEFNKIIDSFKKNGFIKKYHIPINKSNKLLNGAHRIACCLYFNINPYVSYFDEDDHNYNIEWFKENDFTDKEINEIIKTKDKLKRKYSNVNYCLNLKSVYTAIVTPITNNEFNKQIFYKHAMFLKDNGIDGLFLCGNTGSGMNLNYDIKYNILNYANNLSDNFSLICHVGSHNLGDIKKLIKLTNKYNIDCIAAMPPYKKIVSFEKIKKFYEDIARISKKPVLIYHIPNITNIDLTASELIELLNINNVIGIKYTDSNLIKLKEISNKVLNKYIFYGRDDLLLNGLQNGANGGIGGCYNIFPSFINNIINNTDNDKRNKYQRKLNKTIKILREKYPTLPGDLFVKEVLKMKKNMTDEEFYNYLENEYDKINSI